MNEIVVSLAKTRLTKEIRTLIDAISPSYRGDWDLLRVFEDLYRMERIDRSTFLALAIGRRLSIACRHAEALHPGMACGIYLYEENAKRIYNAAAPNLPLSYNEYTHGLDCSVDISPAVENPLYVRLPVIVPNLYLSDNLTSLNHGEAMLSSGLKAYCSMPLYYRGMIIGHCVFYWRTSRRFSSVEIASLYAISNRISRTIRAGKADMMDFCKMRQP